MFFNKDINIITKNDEKIVYFVTNNISITTKKETYIISLMLILVCMQDKIRIKNEKQLKLNLIISNFKIN